MRLIFVIIILSVALSSCNNKTEKKTFEEQIINVVFKSLDCNQETDIIINNKQGSFICDSLRHDSLQFSYTSFLIGGFTNIDKTERFSKIQEYGDTIGMTMFGRHNINDKINGLTVYDVSFLSDYLIRNDSTSKNLIDWDKLKNDGITCFYTISEIAFNETEKYGLIGLQKYSADDFQLLVKFFSFEDSVKVKDFWKDDFRILDYKCRYKNNKLTSLELNSMIVK